MGDIVKFDGITKLDLPVERVLQEAIKADLEGVVVIGYTKNDGNEYMASSYAAGDRVCWLMERCKLMLLMGVDEEG